MKPQMTPVRTLTLLAAVAAISGFWSSGLQAQTPTQTPTQTQTQIYGSQLMTDAERVEFQTKMRSLKTDKERDALRLDQINKMNLRATEKGITLQHTPPQLPVLAQGPAQVLLAALIQALVQAKAGHQTPQAVAKVRAGN